MDNKVDIVVKVGDKIMGTIKYDFEEKRKSMQFANGKHLHLGQRYQGLGTFQVMEVIFMDDYGYVMKGVKSTLTCSYNFTYHPEELGWIYLEGQDKPL